MTGKTLEHSNVWYGPRVGGSGDEKGSPLRAEALFVEGGGPGRVRLHFRVGNLRGYQIEVYLAPHDFRTVLDLMTDADAATTLREMSAILAEAFQDNDNE